MNEQVVLISYGEIALKKGRRHLFEKKLLDNLRKTLKGNGCHQFKTLRGRIKIGRHERSWCRCSGCGDSLRRIH